MLSRAAMPERFAFSLDIQNLLQQFKAGALHPEDAIDEVCARIARDEDKSILIDIFTRSELDAQLAVARQRQREGLRLPLLGIPFAVKDNMDVAGHPTTAACPAFAYTPTRTADAITRLQSAGAILVGKTNMDQFATGLVGTRSPYGIGRNRFNRDYIAGGSSTGSGLAVGAGLVSFALGTDTAGSGRVPAAFNNIIGLKPSRGLLSCAGVVPACRSIDCVSIFGLTSADVRLVFQIAMGDDPADPYSRSLAEIRPRRPLSPNQFRFGVPRAEDLRFFGNEEFARLYDEARLRLIKLGGTEVTIDYRPLSEAAAMLYAGPWLAERAMVAKDLLQQQPDALLPSTRAILQRGLEMNATSAFQGMYALAQCRRRFRDEWANIDVLALPTTGTIYTIADVQANPIQLNSNLGYYTNFVNLLDLAAIAVPSGFTRQGLPFGLTLFGPAGNDLQLISLSERYHAMSELKLGSTPFSQPIGSPAPATSPTTIDIAVVGAHLSGQPLNYQMTERGCELVRSCRTSGKYKLYALPNTIPAKPGMVRSDTGGAMIEVEVWRMPIEAVGSFLALIGPPLGLGSIELEDGKWVKGFICENIAVAGARDITALGGWRAFLKSN